MTNAHTRGKSGVTARPKSGSGLVESLLFGTNEADQTIIMQPGPQSPALRVDTPNDGSAVQVPINFSLLTKPEASGYYNL